MADDSMNDQDPALWLLCGISWKALVYENLQSLMTWVMGHVHVPKGATISRNVTPDFQGFNPFRNLDIFSSLSG